MPSSEPGSTLSRPRIDAISTSGAPSRPSKIVCIGRNYHAHAAELGNVVPDEPLIFLKPPSSVITAGEPIIIPSGVGRVDYEGEIGISIGTTARHVSEANAWSVVDGIVPLNDVTARDLQRKDSQWSRAKGFDTFCAIGSVCPFHPDAFLDLEIVTRINGVEPGDEVEVEIEGIGVLRNPVVGEEDGGA